METLLSTLETLSQDSDASREAFAVLGVISFLDSEGIQEDLLTPDATHAQVPGYPSNESDFHQCCRLLISSSLVEKGSSQSDITVPRTVQKVVRAKISRDAMVSERFFQHVLTRLTSLWPYISRNYVVGTQGKIDRWPRCATLLPHVSSLIEGYSELRDKGQLSTPSFDLAELIFETSVYHAERSELKEAAQFLDFAASICDSPDATSDLIEYRSRIYRGWIGQAHVTRNRDEYLKYAELSFKAEAEHFEKTGVVTADLASANDHLGIGHNLNSRYREAIPFFEASMKIRQSLPGFRKDWLFTPTYQLAHAYFHLRDDEKSVELLESAIKDRIDALGENDRYSARTGALYYTLGDVKKSQGLLDQSLTLHRKAYTHLNSTVGPKHLATLHCKYKAAAHMVRLHDYETARQYLDDVLYYYRSTPHARRYICRTAFLYSECLRQEGKDFRGMLDESVLIFNEFSPLDRRTAESITEADAVSLVAYDYL